MSDATEPSDVVFSIAVDADGVVGERRMTREPQPDLIAVSREVYEAIQARNGLARFDGTTVTDYEPPPLAVPAKFYVQKVDIWRRATDAEAEQLVALLGTQPVRLQRMFSDATVIASTDEMWPVLLGGITQLLGAARAAELLAPSP